jgi:hypothetical protein
MTLIGCMLFRPLVVLEGVLGPTGHVVTFASMLVLRPVREMRAIS